jgi:hypothetical protein
MADKSNSNANLYRSIQQHGKYRYHHSQHEYVTYKVIPVLFPDKDNNSDQKSNN